MRSLRYILGEKPRTMDDCLDMARKARPGGVELRLIVEERITEMYVCKELLGEYAWQFSCGDCHCLDWYGSFFLHESAAQQASRLDGANRRLERRLGDLEQMGVVVGGKENRFDRSLLNA